MAQQSELNLRALTDRLREKARRKVPESDVEDLVQDVLVVLVEKVQSNQISAIQPYAEGILRHLVYDYYQKRAENQVPLEGKDAESHDSSPEQRVFWQRHLRVVREVSEENAVDQALLEEHFFSGAPLREVASELGVSAGVVNGRLFRFRQKLIQRVGHIFTVMMALGVGLWSRVSRALFVGRLQHATSWTLALLSVGSMGTWWSQHLPEKKLNASQTFQSNPSPSARAWWSDTSPTSPVSLKEESASGGIATPQKKIERPIFFEGNPSPPSFMWSLGGSSNNEWSATSKNKQNHNTSAGPAGRRFVGSWFVPATSAAFAAYERSNSSIFASTTGMMGQVGGHVERSAGSTGSVENKTSSQDGSTTEPKSNTAEPKNPTNTDTPNKPDPEKPTTPTDPKQPNTRQSFCIKRDGRLYRCDDQGNLGEDVSGSNQSSFGCGSNTSCRRIVNGEVDGETPNGPALVIGQKKALAVVGENRYRQSDDQGNTWSEPATPPSPDALLKTAVFILNQRGEIWQQELTKEKWSLLRATQESTTEIRVHLDQLGGLCFEDTFDFRFETRIPGIDPVSSTKLGGLVPESGLIMPKAPALKPTHAPGFNVPTITLPKGDISQGLPIPLPAPQQQTQLPQVPR
ncbi:MAG: sigma-70 family RNA polymerase sigma factor [Myxococcales bacterium]|nr:sigma-70 family RNA polymerase sigma factor [Myxococcales bacterium]